MDSHALRTAMVDSQVRVNDVTDRRLISAMGQVAREAFLPEGKASMAYADMAVETGPGRWMLAARDFSKLVQIASILDTDKVLDIAPGAGYSTAVLSQCAASVVALEADEAAASTLRANLAKAGAANVEVISGALKAGAAAKGAFDVIIVNGQVEEIPKAWLDQLAEGGRLVAPVAEGGMRRARVYTRTGDKTAFRTPFDCQAPALPGFERAAEFRL
ncbi:MAG TPA: protein-L-isoaspartate O-methyltransferase [Hyphomonadaceae bacterium]|nr:protein-L-isoaspartate O-methyltransferase [Hyphomonadaceae bacterium]